MAQRIFQIDSGQTASAIVNSVNPSGAILFTTSSHVGAPAYGHIHVGPALAFVCADDGSGIVFNVFNGTQPSSVQLLHPPCHPLTRYQAQLNVDAAPAAPFVVTATFSDAAGDLGANLSTAVASGAVVSQAMTVASVGSARARLFYAMPFFSAPTGVGFQYLDGSSAWVDFTRDDGQPYVVYSGSCPSYGDIGSVAVGGTKRFTFGSAPGSFAIQGRWMAD
jgi:hypothetical protein